MPFNIKFSRRTVRLRAIVASSALLLGALACDSEEATAPVVESDLPAGADDAAVTTEVEFTPSAATSSSAPGIPFGDYHLPTTRFRAPYTGALLALWPSSASSKLNQARNAGMRVVVSVAGSRRNYTNADGTFSMSKWKNRIAAWRRFSFGTYVSSGTVIGHYLVDEPTCSGCWGGRRITTSQIEEMARYSKSLWPSMATTVRTAPTRLENRDFRYLDFAWAQWEGPHHGASNKQSPERFRDSQVAAARARDLGLVFGLNYLDGGDGSSGVPGTYRNAVQVNRWAMSATEVRRVGAVLARSGYACALLSWQYDTEFLRRSGMSSAVSYVGSVAKDRSRSSCKK